MLKLTYKTNDNIRIQHNTHISVNYAQICYRKNGIKWR